MTDDTDGDTDGAIRHVVQAGPDDALARLDRVIAAALPGLSRSRVKALIEAGQVTLLPGGATIAEPSYRVKSGQSFAIIIPEAHPPLPQGEDIALAVVYEDRDLLVIDKPAGLVVHPAPGNLEGTLVNALIAHCGDSLSGIGGVRRPGIVHRLDKDTSGLMVVAKNDAAHASLTAQFSGRTVSREYSALVWGAPRPPAGAVIAPIGRSPVNRKKMAVLRSGGRPAHTEYATERSFGDPARPVASLLACRLRTGRTHQIRVHLASIGHPVVGDPVYGGGLTPARARGLPPDAQAAVTARSQQALHARRLGFDHPASAERLEFFSEMPINISVLIRILEGI